MADACLSTPALILRSIDLPLALAGLRTRITGILATTPREAVSVNVHSDFADQLRKIALVQTPHMSVADANTLVQFAWRMESLAAEEFGEDSVEYLAWVALERAAYHVLAMDQARTIEDILGRIQWLLHDFREDEPTIYFRDALAMTHGDVMALGLGLLGGSHG